MREESLLAAVLERAPVDRPRFLAEVCCGDAALRQRLEVLLAAHEQAAGRPDPSAAMAAAADATASYGTAEHIGTVIAGRFKLLERIGEGGMGTVWVAEQSQPVRRKVALKLIKPGMDSRSVLSRFEAERQALALMDHPHIAKVLDGGTTETSRPFFAMEYVKGVPFTEYCDRARLSIAERLALFVPVCQAVQHAHQKGIIHRDLKPSNILVCLYDGRPVPKVIDFGLAKAMHQPLTEHTLYTAHGVMMGTPMYMSPEQAELNNLDVDTRTDIYALGVILYELLTGTTPLEAKRFKEAAWGEMLRLIQDEEPPRPSTRLSGSGSLPSVAAQRGLEPVKLAKLVRGELDWIVMKCLEKDRSRRYETANGLARDLERYLHDEPVEACPPSAAYRLRKFMRKHRVGLATAAAILALLLAGVGISTSQAVRARRAERAMRTALVAEADERRLAEHAEQAARTAAAAEKQSKEAAQAREAETQAVLDFVETHVFAAARPEGQEGGLGREVTLRRAIDAALPFVGPSFHRKPLVEARLRLSMGNSFLYLGDLQAAAEQFEAAAALYTAQHGKDHPNTLRTLNRMAVTYNYQGRYADAHKVGQETWEFQKARLGPDHPDTLSTMNALAWSDYFLGRTEEALRLLEQAVALRKAKLGPDHPDTLMSVNNLANIYDGIGRHRDALKLREETLALRKARLGQDHPDILQSMTNVVESYNMMGRYADAAKLGEQALSLEKTRLGPNHQLTLVTMRLLADSYSALGNDEAMKLYEEALAGQTARLGQRHPDTLDTLNCLAFHLTTASVESLRDPSRALALAKTAAQSSDRADSWGTYGIALYRTGDWRRAAATLEKAISLRRPVGSHSANEGFFVAMAYWQLGERHKAREWFDNSVHWKQQGEGKSAVTERIRAEAAKLLGVADKANDTTKASPSR